MSQSTGHSRCVKSLRTIDSLTAGRIFTEGSRMSGTPYLHIGSVRNAADFKRYLREHEIAFPAMMK